LTNVDALIDELERQAALLAAVATGGPRIDDVKREYRDRRRRLAAALERRGLEYPFPWPDLWQWYGILDRQPGGVRPLRAKIRELAAPVIEALERQRSGLSVTDPGSGPLTWADLDARLAGLSAELDGALSRDDLQDVGAGPARSSSIAPPCWRTRRWCQPARFRPRRGTRRPGSASSSQCGRQVALGKNCGALSAPPGSGPEGHERQPRAHRDLRRSAQATVLVVRTLQALAAEATAPAWLWRDRTSAQPPRGLDVPGVPQLM
jgi:hypothetical protein